MAQISMTLNDLVSLAVWNLSNSYLSMNMTHINYIVCIHEYESVWVSVVFNRNCFPKMKDFLRLGSLQAVTYTVKVVVWKRWCKIDTLLLHTTNRKYRMAYQFVSFPVTLVDVDSHSPVAGLIKCNSTNICAIFHMVSTDTACRVVPCV